MRVTVWNEFRHERANPAVAAIYPAGIHATIAQALRAAGVEDVRTATLDEPAQGLPPEILARTDVLVWWGHQHHDEVGDDLAHAICERVHGGMGLVVLHSGHFSKPFRRLMGTPRTVRWRADGELERIWVVAPAHPVAAGVPPYFELVREEMYCEPSAAWRPARPWRRSRSANPNTHIYTLRAPISLCACPLYPLVPARSRNPGG
jgi:trehalose utilization protein